MTTNNWVRLQNNADRVVDVASMPDTTFREAVSYFAHWVHYEICFARMRKAKRRFKNATDKMNDLDAIHSLREDLWDL